MIIVSSNSLSLDVPFLKARTKSSSHINLALFHLHRQCKKAVISLIPLYCLQHTCSWIQACFYVDFFFIYFFSEISKCFVKHKHLWTLGEIPNIFI